MNNLSQKDLWMIRALIQKCGWGEFMRHISSMMAEQADRVERGSEQSKKLEACSYTIHSLNDFFAGCGKFKYVGQRSFEWMIPAEFIGMMKEIIGDKLS